MEIKVCEVSPSPRKSNLRSMRSQVDQIRKQENKGSDIYLTFPIIKFHDGIFSWEIGIILIQYP